jgi:hypothetical protein
MAASPSDSSITEAEKARRKAAVARAHAHNFIEGLERDPAGEPIFDAFVNGDIDLKELGRRIVAIVASRMPR